MENRTIEDLISRRSIRHYKSEQIKDEELEIVLKAGTYAPTGKGLQDPWIVAVQNKEIMQELIKMNAEIMGTDSNPYYDAPTIILVFAPSVEKCKNSVQDGSLVLGNMMNAAHAIGLGSCWINREREMFATEKGKELMKRMNLPEGLIGIGALSLGYPSVPPKQPKPRKKDYYRIIK